MVSLLPNLSQEKVTTMIQLQDIFFFHGFLVCERKRHSFECLFINLEIILKINSAKIVRFVRRRMYASGNWFYKHHVVIR